MIKTILLSITFLAFSFIGCSKNQTVIDVTGSVIDESHYTGDSRKLVKSLKHWNMFKDTRGSSYQYTRNSSSNWGGIKSQTTIVVQDDFVLKRHFYIIGDDDIITSSWREDGFDALNDHKEGAAAKRLDALYDDCLTILNSKENVTLAFDGNGILSRCSYGKRGIFIDNLVFLYH